MSVGASDVGGQGGSVRNRRRAVIGLLALTLRCTPAPPLDATSIVSVALEELFVRREHAQRVNLWLDNAAASPVFGDATIRRTIGREPLALAKLDTSALLLPFPIHGETLASLETLFAARAIGWDAFFREYPGTAGLVEVTAPVIASDGGATLFVGRVCGEHCRTVWRLRLSRAQGDRWQVDSVVAIRLPNA